MNCDDTHMRFSHDYSRSEHQRCSFSKNPVIPTFHKPLRHRPRISRRATLPTTLLLVRRRANTTREERTVHSQSTAWKPLGARRYSALLIHISIGTVYCWSVFKQLMLDQMHVAPGIVEWGFSLAIFFLGMLAAFLGPFVKRTSRNRPDLDGLLRLRIRRHRSQHRGGMASACSSSMA